VQVDRAITKPPAVGGSNVAATPTPASVKKMLPQLADLPKEAETKAKTEADLRAEIVQLRAEMKRASSKPDVEIEADKRAVEDYRRMIKAAVETYGAVVEKMERALKDGADGLAAFKEALSRDLVQQRPARQAEFVIKPEPSCGSIYPLSPFQTARRISAAPRSTDDDSILTGPERRIINAISWLNSIGVEAPSQVAVAFVAGYSPNGGAFVNPRGTLKRKGLINYDGRTIRLTDEGEDSVCVDYADRPASAEDLHTKVMEKLPGPERRLLGPLLEAYPQSLTNEQLAERAGYAPTGGAFVNPRGRLKSLGLIDYDSAAHSSRASDILFPRGEGK